MKKKNFNLQKFLMPSDFLVIAAVIAGIIIMIFIDDTAMRLIGAGISMIGIVALFMLISPRLNDVVEPAFKPTVPQPDFLMTVKKDSSATRQVVENFDSSFEPDDSLKPSPKEEFQHMESDEGFRILKKGDEQQDKNETTEPATKLNNKKQPVETKKEEIKPIEHKPKKVIKPKQEIKEQTAPSDVKPVIEKKVRNIPQDTPVHKIQEMELMEELNEVISDISIQEDSQHEEVVSDYREHDIEVPVSILTEDVSGLAKEPRKEFEYFLKKILTAISNVINVRTAAFFIVNAEKRQIILESFITDVPDCMSKQRKFDINNDIISQILYNSKPEILSEINPSAELDLLPYYDKNAGINSFIGIPVFYDDSLVAILTADTGVSDSYDAYTVGLLAHFTKLLTAVVHSYTEKYDLLQAAKTMEAVNLFQTISEDANLTLDDISTAIVETVSHMFDFTTIGLCCYDENQNGWHLKAYTSKDNTFNCDLGSPIALDYTLTGKSIMTNKTVIASPISSTDIRVNQDEAGLEGGVFIAVPLKTSTNTYGALFIESKNAYELSQLDINILETIAKNAGNNIEKMHFIDMLQSSAMMDPATGILNPPAFYNRLETEIARFNDFENPTILLLFQVDEYASFNPNEYQERTEKVLYHVISIIQKYLKPYDIFGRADANTFGLVLVGIKLDQAQIMAEQIRNEIAISLMNINGHKFNMTVSIGLAPAYKNDSVDSIVSNARQVLDLSMDKTNTVSVFA